MEKNGFYFKCDFMPFSVLKTESRLNLDSAVIKLRLEGSKISVFAIASKVNCCKAGRFNRHGIRNGAIDGDHFKSPKRASTTEFIDLKLNRLKLGIKSLFS